jgi:hypothetical protein
MNNWAAAVVSAGPAHYDHIRLGGHRQHPEAMVINVLADQVHLGLSERAECEKLTASLIARDLEGTEEPDGAFGGFKDSLES